MNQYPQGVELEDIPCPLEGCTQYEVVVQGHDILYNIPGTFRVVRCSQCGLMRTTPRPTLETIGIYYPDNYRPYQTTIPADLSNRPSSGFKRFLKHFVRFDTDVLPDLPRGTMLEIGCASGSFMYQMAQKGWRVEGIEPDPNASAAARNLGFNVHTGALETAPEKDSLYDLVVGWMVLEHLHEPIFALKRLHCWTKPSGWLVFSVPNAASWEFKWFRESWYALQLPTHTFHYNPKTIKDVLAAGGWRLERVYHQRILTNLFASAGYWLKKHGVDNELVSYLTHFNKLPRQIRLLLFPLAWFLSLFGQTGRMTIWARRIDD